MSKFKKMRLVPFDEEPQSNLETNLKNIVTFETPAQIKQMSELDNQIESILNSNLDVDSKSKLYSDSLRKFMNIKRKYSQSEIKNKTPICVDIDSNNQPNQHPQPSKRKRIVNKLGKKSLKVIKSIVKSRDNLPTKKKSINKKKNPLSLDHLLKPSQVKEFIETLANNNGPTWTEY